LIVARVNKTDAFSYRYIYVVSGRYVYSIQAVVGR